MKNKQIEQQLPMPPLFIAALALVIYLFILYRGNSF